MTNDKILKELYSLKEQLKTKDLYPLTLKELIEGVQENIKKESLPDTTTKRRYNAIKKFLSQKHLQSRPILQLTHHENGYQVFTDSYALFRFFDDEIIEQLPRTDGPEGKNLPPYPQTEKLCNDVFSSLLETDFYSIKDLKHEIKITENDYIDISLNEAQKARLDKKLFTQFINIMGFKNNDEINFKYLSMNGPGYTTRPVSVVMENKQGLILPLRTE